MAEGGGRHPGDGRAEGRGEWHYRVSATFDPTDTDNPGGESRRQRADRSDQGSLVHFRGRRRHRLVRDGAAEAPRAEHARAGVGPGRGVPQLLRLRLCEPEGRLPDAAGREASRAALAEGRALAFARLDRLGDALDRAGGMDALRAAVGHLSPEDGFDAPGRITGAVAVFAAAWSRIRSGARPIAPDPSASHAADYLRMIRGEPPSPGEPAKAEAWIEGELQVGRRIMGMGHRIYRVRDALLLAAALLSPSACSSGSPPATGASSIQPAPPSPRWTAPMAPRAPSRGRSKGRPPAPFASR